MADDADLIIDLYQRRALLWDKERGRGLMEKNWLDRFIALLPSDRRVLDIGCGAGEPIGRYLLEAGCAVTGIDSAPAMINLARSRLQAGDWHVADMRTLTLGRRFDGLLAWDSFFHLRPDDQRAMLAVFVMHAAPWAALMFTSGPVAGLAIGAMHGEPLYHASLEPAEYRTLLATHGFTVVAHVAEDVSCGGHTVWLAQRA
ncbi:MAG: class I SAM-dependent methyltransferase [Hyphomonadaceae bacterium]|jgi:trans-aconitate methyltransferase|nr:class I SAM-dependent methyltransferase [Hyphomonadaceae bacterium]